MHEEPRRPWRESMLDGLYSAVDGLLSVATVVLNVLLFPVRKRAVPSDAERAACVTIQDLVKLGFAHPVDLTKERWSGWLGRFDRSRAAEYHYDVRTRPGYCELYCDLDQLTSSDDATISFTGSRLARLRLDSKKVDELRKEGREAVLYDIRLSNGGTPVGTYFIARSGFNVLTMMLIGPRFDDVEEWRQFVTEKMERMDALSRT